MKKIKIITGIIWAFLGLILIIIFFFRYNAFSNSAAKLSFMKINPNYSGGEVIKKLITPNCTLDIRKPVFDGLIGERKRGFVQIDWRGKIPDLISDSIDYDSDSKTDFIITINTTDSKASIVSSNPKVENISISSKTSYGWAARVKLSK